MLAARLAPGELNPDERTQEMALRIGEKISRVTTFLLGLRNRRIAATLVQYGFSDAEYELGWTLFRRAVGEKLNIGPVPVRDPESIERLDAWENRWLPIARAALTHRYPAVNERVFLNLSQTRGPEVMISVRTFLDRVEALASGDTEEQAASALLETRGIVGAVVAEARALLGQLESLEQPPVENVEEVKAAQDEAVAAMWAWYIEWSTISRTAIADGHLLQRLGYRRGSRRAVQAEVDAGVESAIEDESSVTPIELGEALAL